MINDLNLHENAKLVEISICTKQVSKTRDTKNIELDLMPEIIFYNDDVSKTFFYC